MSSMLSAPAAIPATSDITFAPALAPLSEGTVSRCCASPPNPASAASLTTGTSPADDTKFGSSNDAATTGAV